MQNTAIQFSWIIKQLRKRDQLTQEQCSRQLDLTRSNVANYESGTRQPSLEALIRIARFFNVSLDYLVFGVPEANRGQETPTDELSRELMAENTILMQTQNELLAEVQAQKAEIVALQERLELQRKYISLLEEKVNK